jgi:hypothetical protein
MSATSSQGSYGYEPEPIPSTLDASLADRVNQLHGTIRLVVDVRTTGANATFEAR